MEVMTLATIFVLATAVCELVLLPMLMPKPIWLWTLGNKTATNATHLVVGFGMAWYHAGTMTGTMAAILGFLFSFPALLTGKHAIYGWTCRETFLTHEKSDDKLVVIKKNLDKAKKLMSDAQYQEALNGKVFGVSDPVYHVRAIRHKTKNVLGIYAPARLMTDKEIKEAL